MASVKDRSTLVSYFKKKYKEHYGAGPSAFNDFAARYGFDAVLDSMDLDSIKGLIDYYFTTVSPNKHNIDWFFYNYHKLMKSKIEHEIDSAQREKLRAESKDRAARWRERIGNQGTTGN